MASNSIAEMLREKLEQKKKQLKELEEYCHREEETLRLTADLSSHKGYNYYKTEHEKSFETIERKRNEIDALISAFTQKKEAEFEAFKARWDTNAKMYQKGMEDIEVSITTPKSIIYKRKMTDILRLREEIPHEQGMYNAAENREMEIRQRNSDYRRKEAIKEILKAEEDEKALAMKDFLAKKAINDAAEEKSRHKRIRNGLEADDDGVYHTEESYDAKFAPKT